MPIVNGQEMKSIGQMKKVLEATPGLGQRTLRAEASWDGTFDSRVIVDPVIQGSGGECMYAEELLEVLAKCVAFDALGHGTELGLEINAVRVRVEGDIDLLGSVGGNAPAGFTALRIKVHAATDAPNAALQKLSSTISQRSIVAQSLSAVPQTVEIQHQEAVLQ